MKRIAIVSHVHLYMLVTELAGNTAEKANILTSLGSSQATVCQCVCVSAYAIIQGW